MARKGVCQFFALKVQRLQTLRPRLAPSAGWQLPRRRSSLEDAGSQGLHVSQIKLAELLLGGQPKRLTRSSVPACLLQGFLGFSNDLRLQSRAARASGAASVRVQESPMQTGQLRSFGVFTSLEEEAPSLHRPHPPPCPRYPRTACGTEGVVRQLM